MVTTLQETELYAAISHYLTSNGHIADYRMLVNFPATGHTNLVDKVEWRIAPPVLPTAQNLIDAYNAYLAAQTSESVIVTAQTGLKNKIALAEQFASSIAAVLNVSLQQTEDATTQPTRFNNIKAVMDAQPAAFRNRFNGDLLQETGIVIASIVVLDYPNYCRYIRQWSTQLSLLLLARKAL